MTENDGEDKKKAHRSRQAGVKAKKKKDKLEKNSNQKQTELSARERNPKAFAINSAQRAERNFRRKEDLIAKKQHIPVVDQTGSETPPVLIAIVGPPKVGKTTLIKNLIKNFTRTNVNEVRGPITIVTSKKRRLTLLECNNDINSMIDVAKCADLVLLLCDASYGFEMEIFEFLNICQVHGMPKIMGVLTHLDMMKNPKQIRRRKKELKHRFWTEVYNGAKLFYLSGIIHGEYLRNEIQNLGRFISIMKYRPLQWRGTHGYVLIDRLEDITNSHTIRSNPKCERDVVLYGYIRGVPMRKENKVHIAGFGDAFIDELSLLPDPCPLPGTEKKRSLLEKERLLYAPMSGVGGLVYDKDAVYIELSGSHSHKIKNAEQGEQEDLMGKLLQKKNTVDIQTEEQEFRLFSDGAAIKSKDYNSDEMSGGNDDDQTSDEESIDDSGSDTNDEADVFADENEGEKSSDGENDEMEIENSSSDEEYQDHNKYSVSLDENDSKNVVDNAMSWKENIAEKARENYLQRHSESRNLMRLVYGVYKQTVKFQDHDKEDNEKGSSGESGDDNEDEIGELFKSVATKQVKLSEQRSIRDKDENCSFSDNSGHLKNWLETQEMIKDCFVTGKWKSSEDAENLLKLDQESDSDVYGDFEDLEAGKSLESTIGNEKVEDDSSQSKILEKKLKLKEKFDNEYDNKSNKESNGRITGDHDFYEALKADAQKQSDLNKKEFENVEKDMRIQIEGFRPGLYVRMGFKNFPAEFVESFDPSYPILVGALNAAEENIGFVHCKVKKHRWYKKILKSRDPLIISLGWRRFQTVSVYAKVEDNFRHRYLKYTPNHVTCGMTFWGPITPQNTGFLALQSVRHNVDEVKRIGFRIAATGCVTEVDKSTKIVKKLKLVGYPFKIFKKSAFIKDMFNSSLEVAKFEGAKIKTVSGIRGQIKKAHHTPEGSFRATFEDKILLSDIVFCRTWYPVEVPRFYTTVQTLLLPLSLKSEWQGMKTLGQLKREQNIKNEAQPDSLYTEITREPKVFKKLKIPKALQRALPYKVKPKYKSLEKGVKFEETRVAVINSPHEQKVAKIMKIIETNYKDKQRREKLETKNRLKKFREEKKIESIHRIKRQKEIRKKISRAKSKMKSKQDN